MSRDTTVTLPAAGRLALQARRAAPASWRRLRRLRGGLVGGLAIAIIVASAALAPWIAPHSPFVGRIIDRLLPPAGSFPRFLAPTIPRFMPCSLTNRRGPKPQRTSKENW